MAQPPSGDSVIKTQMRSASVGSPAETTRDLDQLFDDDQPGDNTDSVP
jgi:hypothetical protein